MKNRRSRSKESEKTFEGRGAGKDDMKAVALKKEKIQEIKAAALEATGMKAAALEYVKLNLWKLRPRRSYVKRVV